MNTDVWKYVWNEFCESQTHLDSLISKIPEKFGPNIKSEVATRFGPFLRRPWAIARALGVNLAETPEAFWNQNYIQLRKNENIHLTLEKLSHGSGKLPSEGSVDDFPSSITEAWEKDWGKPHVQRLCALLSQDPLTMIRVHRDFSSGAQEAFPRSRPGHFSPHARIFKGYEPVLNTDFYRDGGLEIQDEGSQLMAYFALYPEIFSQALRESPQIQKNEFHWPDKLPTLKSSVWIDACAGAGGKTLALADFLGGQGRIYAYDIYEKKIQALRKRVARAKETNIQAFVMNPEALSKTQSRFKESADGVLMDSPCSGHGVLRRNPDIKWSRKPLSKEHEKLLTISDLQRKVLMDYSGLVKPGGRLIFGVCTFSKEETLKQVEWFLEYSKEQKQKYILKNSGFIGPYETDGFFMACLEREQGSRQ